MVYPPEAHAGLQWKDIDCQMHMEVLLQTLSSWHTLAVPEPEVHKDAVCKSFLYFAHSDSIEDDAVL